MMAAAIIIVVTQALHAILGGVAVLCLYYAATVSDHDVIFWFLTNAFEWGSLATIVSYFQGKYLDV